MSPQNHTTTANYLIMRKAPAETETVAECDARFWDNFYSLKRSFRKFESDEDPYRKTRGVETFNAATQVSCSPLAPLTPSDPRPLPSLDPFPLTPWTPLLGPPPPAQAPPASLQGPRKQGAGQARAR